MLMNEEVVYQFIASHARNGEGKVLTLYLKGLTQFNLSESKRIVGLVDVLLEEHLRGVVSQTSITQH